jgi:16S rRNA (uracil1498-N3)-methyltransferase
MNLLLLTDEDFLDDKSIKLVANDPRYIHIKKILKLKQGDTCKAGWLERCIGLLSITSFSDKFMVATFMPSTQIAPKPYAIQLILGATRPLVMRRLLKDITSMGVAHLTVFHSENGEKSYLESSLFKDKEFHRAIADGLAQSASIYPPTIHLAKSLEQALHLTARSNHSFILDPYANALWPTHFIQDPKQSIALLIGSERGFTAKELELAKSSGYQAIRLMPHILRTETAVASTLSLAIHAIELAKATSH